jgi:hypothetical protein
MAKKDYYLVLHYVEPDPAYNTDGSWAFLTFSADNPEAIEKVVAEHGKCLVLTCSEEIGKKPTGWKESRKLSS